MEQQHDLVSVIMAAYNAEKYIGKSIESILNQTYRNLELIIIDDCSSDCTLDIVKNYSLRDKRIVVHSNTENIGACHTRNKAVAIAQGKYIAINDADDIAMPDRFEKQVAFLEKYSDYVLVASRVQCFYDESYGDEKPWGSIEDLEKYHFNYISSDGDYKKTSVLLKKDMIEKNRLCHSSVMGRATFFKSQPYKNIFAEDTELFLRALLLGHKITKLPEILVRYRIVGSGLSAGFSKLKTDKALKALIGMDKEILQEAIKARAALFIVKFLYHRLRLYGLFRIKQTTLGILSKVWKKLSFNFLPAQSQ